MRSSQAELMVLRAEVTSLRAQLDALLQAPRKPPKSASRRTVARVDSLEETRRMLLAPMTPAKAAKLRQLQRTLCGCNRCQYNALPPVLTFAEHQERMAAWDAIAPTPFVHRDWTQLLGGAR